MARNILLTSLTAAETDISVQYFSIPNKSGCDYCNALLDTEASIKAVLSRYSIDEIVIIGGDESYDKKDELSLTPLKRESETYSKDNVSFSTYGLLQYRLAMYADNMNSDQTEKDENLPEEVQEKLIRFIRDFPESNPQLESKSLNRLFDLLTQNSEICEKFWSALFEAFPDFGDNPDFYKQWVKSYLFEELEPSAKMKLLPENEGVCIRFIPEARLEDGGQWLDSMMAMKNSITEYEDDINLYISLNGDNGTDTFIILNMLNILVTMPGSGVKLKKIFAIHNIPWHMTRIIQDDTIGFDITELFHAIRSFLNYGKADMIVDIWKKSGDQNDQIKSMVYAMRDVDVGLSMCNIPVVEHGILRLRELFESEEFWRTSGYYGMMFSIIAESIREDYGRLLEGDGKIPFIDLVKWAYRHQFYQQTLTLIESNAPEVLVRYGIFYYCGDEKQKDHVTNLFARKRMELKPQEYFKIDNIDHYFIKAYDRIRARDRGQKGEDPQHVYAVLRTESINNTDPEQITGLTVCDNTETLQNLLYAYYKIGNVRNKIAHADSAGMTGKDQSTSENGEISSLVWMKDAIDFFISSYEKAIAEVEGKKPNVIIISGNDVRKAAQHGKHSNSPHNNSSHSNSSHSNSSHNRSH